MQITSRPPQTTGCHYLLAVMGIQRGCATPMAEETSPEHDSAYGSKLNHR